MLAALLLFCQDKFILFGDPQRIDNAVMNDVNDFFTLIKKHLRIYRFCLVMFHLAPPSLSFQPLYCKSKNQDTHAKEYPQRAVIDCIF